MFRTPTPMFNIPSPMFRTPEDAQKLFQAKSTEEGVAEELTNLLPAEVIEPTGRLVRMVQQNPAVMIAVNEVLPGTIHQVAAKADVPIPANHIARGIPAEAAAFVGVNAEMAVIDPAVAIGPQRMPSQQVIVGAIVASSPKAMAAMSRLPADKLASIASAMKISVNQPKEVLIQQIVAKANEGVANALGGPKRQLRPRSAIPAIAQIEDRLEALQQMRRLARKEREEKARKSSSSRKKKARKSSSSKKKAAKKAKPSSRRR